MQNPADEVDRTSSKPVWSPNGRLVAFTSYAAELVAGDTNGRLDVFVWTLEGGTIQRINTDLNGNQTDSGYGSYDTSWSPNSDRIAFTSDAANLIGGDTNNADDVFVKTLVGGAVERISVNAAGDQGNGISRWPAWSPDGTRIAFGSRATNLVSGDTNFTDDLFIKDLGTQVVQRVNTDKDGNQASPGSYSTNLVWSADSRRVAFDSDAPNLVPNKTTWQREVLVKDLLTGAVVTVSTDKDGQPATDYSRYPAWSPSGTQIVFESFASNLVDGDTNSEWDIFVKTLG